MKRFMRRIFIGRRTVYVTAIAGSITIITSVSVNLVPTIPEVIPSSFFVLAVLFFCASWLSYVLSERVAARNEQSAIGHEELSNTLSELEVAVEQKLCEHTRSQLDEYKTQAFNNLVALQEFKFSLLEDSGRQHDD